MDPAKVKALIDALTANPVDPDAVQKAATDLLAELAGAGGAPSTMPPPPDGSAENADPVPPAPGTATTSKLAKGLGFKSDADLVDHYKMLRASVDALTADKDAAELDARRALIADFVQLGIETPATAWEGDPAQRKPSRRLNAEPVADMRARLVALKAARPTSRAIVAPSETPDVADEVAKLSANTLKAIKAQGLTPEQFIVARGKAARRI